MIKCRILTRRLNADVYVLAVMAAAATVTAVFIIEFYGGVTSLSAVAAVKGFTSQINRTISTF